MTTVPIPSFDRPGLADEFTPLSGPGRPMLYTKPMKPGGSGFGRIDVIRAVAGLRHIEPSVEPSLVFSNLAAVCVPAMCDEVVIDLTENGHGYRIRRPATEWTATRTAAQVPPEPHPPVTLTSDEVVVALPAVAGTLDHSVFSGVLTCRWTDGYAPTLTDAALIQLMVDHAVALIQREQSSRSPHRFDDSPQKLHSALSRSRRIASAVGIVMALHHVDQAQAMSLLIRISERSHVNLHDLAATVVSTGSLPSNRNPAARRDTASR